MSVKLQIITPKRTAFSADVDFTTVPGIDGEIGILPKHAKMIGRLKYGELRAKMKEKTKYFFIEEGFLRVNKEGILVLTYEALSKEEMDEKELKKQKEELEGKNAEKISDNEKNALQKLDIKLKILGKAD